MCLRRAPEKYIAGAALDRAGLAHPHSWIPYLQMLGNRGEKLAFSEANRYARNQEASNYWLRGFSQRANYTDRAAAACRRS
jgi:hypothetical protein